MSYLKTNKQILSLIHSTDFTIGNFGLLDIKKEDQLEIK